MKNAYIKDIAVYLPHSVLTNEDLEKEFPEWTAQKIFDKVGIKSRHIAAVDETALDMAEKACNVLFSQNTATKDTVDFILLCTQSADYKLPTSACILQHRLGLPSSVGALDFNLGCSGYCYSLALAKGLIAGGMAQNVLLVTSETYSKYLHPLDKGNRCLFGDAATATLVSSEGFARIGECIFGTDGSGAESLIVKNGGARNPFAAANAVSYDDAGHIVSPNHLYMDGAGIFSFTLKRVPKMLKSLLEKSLLSMEDIDFFVFHQANAYMLSHLQKKLKISDDRFVLCIEDVGNTVSSTIPLALFRLRKEKSLEDKKHICTLGFGVGLSWAGAMIDI